MTYTHTCMRTWLEGGVKQSLKHSLDVVPIASTALDVRGIETATTAPPLHLLARHLPMKLSFRQAGTDVVHHGEIAH